MHLLFDIPIVLGPTGVALLGLVIAILGLIVGIQWFQRESRSRLRGEIEKWKTVAEASKSTVDFAQSELTLVRERCERLESENKSVLADNVLLRQKTDLEVIRQQQDVIQNDIAKGRDLAVSAIIKRLDAMDQGLTEMHTAQLAALQQISSTLSEQHREFCVQMERGNNVIEAQANLIKSLQSQLELRKALDS